jgi:ribosome-binding factor A
MSGGLRGQRLAGTIRKLLSAMLARSLEDPRLHAVGIEQVNLSRDLGVATIGVRLMYGEADAKAQKAVMTALERATPHLRTTLAASLRMRRMPELRFVYDQGEDYRRNVERILAQIETEPKVQADDDEAVMPTEKAAK